MIFSSCSRVSFGFAVAVEFVRPLRQALRLRAQNKITNRMATISGLARLRYFYDNPTFTPFIPKAILAREHGICESGALDDYSQNSSTWAEYRRRRTLTWAVPLTLILVAFGLSVPTPWPFIVAIIVFGVLYFRFERWRCPRCSRPFTEPKRDLAYSKQCWNCGLHLWGDPGDVVGYRERQCRVDAMLAAHTADVHSKERQRLWRMFAKRDSRGTSRQRR